VVCLAGAEFAFAQASELVLPKLAGLHVSESTVERLTEAAGQQIGQRLEDREVFGPSTPWAWHRDAEGKSCGYVAVDATGVGQQGPGGAAAEGRMATVAMVYNPVPEHRSRWANPQGRGPRFQARYVAGLEGRRAWASRYGGRPRRWGWTGLSAGLPCLTAGPGWRTGCGCISAGWRR
jgi:hypothetical protein